MISFTKWAPCDEWCSAPVSVSALELRNLWLRDRVHYCAGLITGGLIVLTLQALWAAWLVRP